MMQKKVRQFLQWEPLKSRAEGRKAIAHSGEILRVCVAGALNDAAVVS
jgi:hypothetical protein